MQPATALFLSMLLGQAPLLVVYVGALLASVILWSRYPRPARFVFVGSLLLLLTTLVWPFLQTWMMNQRAAGGINVDQMGQRLAVVSLVMSVVRAAAYVLLVGAAFVGRRSERVESGFPMASRRVRPRRRCGCSPFTPPLRS